MDEGYIKYNCRWIKEEPVLFEGYEKINSWRQRLHQLGLIGMNPDKIGFGNISLRVKESGQFHITGSATGGLENLTPAHYTLVTDFDFKANSLTCKGPVKASSESLSHAAIYSAIPDMNAVIHIHHLKSWQKLIDRIPTTSSKVPYGTPEMSFEILRLLKETDLKTGQVLVMGGHPQGLIAFGRDMEEAGKVLFKELVMEE